MRNRIHGAALIGVMVLSLLSCVVSIPRKYTPTPAELKDLSTFGYKPTQTIIKTPAITFTPSETATLAPTATPRYRAEDASAYKLAAFTADQMDEFIQQYEASTLKYMNEFKYAAGEDL
ncbi:MAG: hypothetical protein JXR32_09350, partial [Anaerolineaceae bacterium]|nr:hypothetical protein [Anaerolineaceae bacterium]